MTNHDRFVEVFKSRGGQTFATKQIKELMEKESDIAPGSVLPNDHAKGNKSACRCADTDLRIFDRLMRGRYKVRTNLHKLG
jgi:hypothetical protein